MASSFFTGTESGPPVFGTDPYLQSFKQGFADWMSANKPSGTTVGPTALQQSGSNYLSGLLGSNFGAGYQAGGKTLMELAETGGNVDVPLRAFEESRRAQLPYQISGQVEKYGTGLGSATDLASAIARETGVAEKDIAAAVAPYIFQAQNANAQNRLQAGTNLGPYTTTLPGNVATGAINAGQYMRPTIDPYTEAWMNTGRGLVGTGTASSQRQYGEAPFDEIMKALATGGAWSLFGGLGGTGGTGGTGGGILGTLLNQAGKAVAGGITSGVGAIWDQIKSVLGIGQLPVQLSTSVIPGAETAYSQLVAAGYPSNVATEAANMSFLEGGMYASQAEALPSSASSLLSLPGADVSGAGASFAGDLSSLASTTAAPGGIIPTAAPPSIPPGMLDAGQLLPTMTTPAAIGALAPTASQVSFLGDLSALAGGIGAPSALGPEVAGLAAQFMSEGLSEAAAITLAQSVAMEGGGALGTQAALSAAGSFGGQAAGTGAGLAGGLIGALPMIGASAAMIPLMIWAMSDNESDAERSQKIVADMRANPAGEMDKWMKQFNTGTGGGDPTMWEDYIIPVMRQMGLPVNPGDPFYETYWAWRRYQESISQLGAVPIDERHMYPTPQFNPYNPTTPIPQNSAPALTPALGPYDDWMERMMMGDTGR